MKQEQDHALASFFLSSDFTLPFGFTQSQDNFVLKIIEVLWTTHINSLVKTEQFDPHNAEASKFYQMVSGLLRNPFPSDCEAGKIILPDALDLLRTSNAMENVSDYKGLGKSLCPNLLSTLGM